MKRILTGLKPSGELTLGSLIGCINQMVKLQDEYDSFMFVPDMHAITVKQDPKMLRERIRKNVALYLACGVDPDKNTIYLQSENLYHANLSWVLECTTYMGEASRMTQYKDKSSKGENVTVGLFTYPILMAADILLYDADYVPVGIDQKQHVELARDIALRFNKTYGDTFKMPEPMMSEVGVKIMDLQEPTKKMSKSDETYKGVILLLDDEKTIRKKIMSAVTDSDNKIYYDKDNKPGVSNLLTIYSYLKNISIEENKDIKYLNDYDIIKIVYVTPYDYYRSDLIESTLENVNDRDKENIINLLNIFDPDVVDFKLVKKFNTGRSYIYIDHNVYGTTPLFSFGDSIKKIFTLATAMISAKGGILLVDEIESAIHKNHINKVFNSIIKICKEYKVQLICTTHSLEAIDGIILSLGNQIDLLSCFRIEVYNNKTYYTKFSGDRLKDIRNLLGQDVR